MRRSAAGALAALLVALALPVGADRSADLEELRRAVLGSRALVAGYEREGRGLLEAGEALDRTAATLEREVNRGRQRAKEAKRSLGSIRVQAEEMSQKLDATRQAMSGRAVSLYKAGEAGAVRLLFSSGGLREFLSRVNALRVLLRHDVDLLQRHRRQSATLAEAESSARAAEGRWKESVAELTQRRGELAAERTTKRELVKHMHSARSRARQALIEFETAARALEDALGDLGESPETSEAGSVRFARLRGKLAPPGSAVIARRFGRRVDARFQTETYQRGIEYAADLGAPVRAVAPGHVRFAGWFSGYGQIVILEHDDDYYTVYGHLSKIGVEPGERVETRRAVGSVGDTGSLEGPRLYFEIRHGNEPVDPSEWLASTRAG